MPERSKHLPEKLSQHSLEYEVEQEERYENALFDTLVGERIFGVDFVKNAIKISRLSADDPSRKGREKELDEQLQDLKNHLTELFESENGKHIVVEFIESSVGHLNVKVRDVEKQAKKLIEQVDRPMLVKSIREHVKVFKRVEAEFEETIEERKNRFVARSMDLLDRIGVTYDAQLIEDRVRSSHIFLNDSLSASSDELLGAEHDVDRNEVYINSYISIEDHDQSIDHELFHVISGRTVQSEPMFDESELEEGDEMDFDTVTQRFGFRFTPGVGDRRLIWLNEAMTEHLMTLLDASESVDLLDSQTVKSHLRESSDYLGSRELMYLLLTQGSRELDLRTFTQAYMEDYDPGQPKEERMQAWREMIKSIKESYSPGFFMALDRYVEENGVTEAIKVMQTDWRTIMAK